MDLAATYHDGITAESRSVLCRIEGVGHGGRLCVLHPERLREIASWRLTDIEPVPGKRNELRLANVRTRPGERIVFDGREVSVEARKRLPVLMHHRRREQGRQFRLVALATAALASVIAVYLFGVPLMARQVVGLIPPAAEVRFGDAVVEQVADALADQGGLEICDTDPDSLANRAIRRFAATAVEGVDTPFDIDIQVVRNTIPNAFALPGGRAFYFSGLLEQTESADEFAGVMAHEIGHVVHRHGMQSIVATAGTGLLVGFVLGDITGVSIAAGVGSALINNSFSRDSERQADAFVAEVAEKMRLRPSAFAQLLSRISEDDSFSRAMALLSTHPLTEERLVSMRAFDQVNENLPPAFSPEEWRAIRSMCGAKKPGPSKSKSRSS